MKNAKRPPLTGSVRYGGNQHGHWIVFEGQMASVFKMLCAFMGKTPSDMLAEIVAEFESKNAAKRLAKVVKEVEGSE